MRILSDVVSLLGKLVGVLALPGLVAVAEILVAVLPASIEWGVVRTAFSLLQNEWRFEAVKRLCTMERPEPGVQS